MDSRTPDLYSSLLWLCLNMFLLPFWWIIDIIDKLFEKVRPVDSTSDADEESKWRKYALLFLFMIVL